MAMAVALVLLLLTACGPARHDLEVVNAWDRGVTVSVVAERAGPPDQAAPLGPVRVGAIKRFSVVLADGQDRFRFHYGYHSGIYAEQTDSPPPRRPCASGEGPVYLLAGANLSVAPR